MALAWVTKNTNKSNYLQPRNAISKMWSMLKAPNLVRNTKIRGRKH